MWLPDQAGSVCAMGEDIGDVHAQEPKAGNHFHRDPSDVRRRRGESVLPEVISLVWLVFFMLMQ